MVEFYFCKCAQVKKTVDALVSVKADALLLDAHAVCCQAQFEAAYEMAKLSFETGENVSSSRENEILLYVSCQTYVKRAIEIAGAKDSEPALIAVFGKEKKIDFSKLGIERIEMEFGGCTDAQLKEKIEKMAVSRIKN